jgi:hypothetical protein
MTEQSQRSDPVTVVATRRVKPDREADYEAWLARLVAEVAEQFDGYLGAEHHRPNPGSNEYTSVFRFDTVEHLRAFELSELRARYLREAAGLVEADAVWRRYTGLEFWFEPPVGTAIPQPSRFRMAVLLTGVVYLLALGVGALATWTAGHLVPAPIRLLAVVIVQVALMTYLVMPYLTRRLSSWIYPTSLTITDRRAP